MKGLIVFAALTAFLVPLEAHDLVDVVGVRGSGKSTFAKKLAAVQLEHGKRVLAWDPKDEWSAHGRKRKHVDLGPLAHRCTVERLRQHPEWLSDPKLSLAVVSECSALDTEGIAEDFRDFVELVELTGDLVLFVDEVGLLRDAAPEALLIVGTQSRHWGNEGTPTVLVAQCMTLIEPKARKQVSMLITGTQHDPADLAAIEDMLIMPMGKESAEKFIQQVATMKRPGLIGWREAA